NLDNTAALLARADIELPYNGTASSWDDRAFTSVDDAVAVQAADGTLEHGLFLLPHRAISGNKGVDAEVQMFTFSDHTLTQRGRMNHGTDVRRSFQLRTTTTANISDLQLSLFDTADPDSAKQLSRLDVAPDYRDIFVYGDRAARVHAGSVGSPE